MSNYCIIKLIPEQVYLANLLDVNYRVFKHVLSNFVPPIRHQKYNWLLGDFPAIRNLISLNDLNNLNDLSSLNGFISSKHLLSLMLLLTRQQNYLSWSLNVEWIIKNPQFYGFLALFLFEAVEAMDVTFNQIQVS